MIFYVQLWGTGFRYMSIFYSCGTKLAMYDRRGTLLSYKDTYNVCSRKPLLLENILFDN